MRQVDFGRLIASLRKEHEDEDGYPWSQAVLAQQFNLVLGAEVFNEHIVGKIERGQRGLDREELVALATALQLTSGERKEFFLAASGIDNESIARQDNDPGEVLMQLVDRMKHVRLPAHIMNCYCDIVALNLSMVELLDLQRFGHRPDRLEATPFPFNKVLYAFSDEAEEHLGRLMGEQWSGHLYESMILFRTASLRYRSTEYFQSLLKELKKSLRFRHHWRDVYFEEKDHFVETRQMYFDSPKWGPVSYFPAYLTAVTSAGELHLCVYAPTTSETAEVFMEIHRRCGDSDPVVLDYWLGSDLSKGSQPTPVS